MRRMLGSLSSLFLRCLVPGTILSLLLALGVWWVQPWTKERLRRLVDHAPKLAWVSPGSEGGAPTAWTPDVEHGPLAALSLRRRAAHLAEPKVFVDMRSGWPADTFVGMVPVDEVLDTRLLQNWHPVPEWTLEPPAISLERGVLVLRDRSLALVRAIPFGPSRGEHLLLPIGVDLLGAIVNAVVATCVLTALAAVAAALRRLRRAHRGRCGGCGYRRHADATTESRPQESRVDRKPWRRRLRPTVLPWAIALAVAFAVTPLLSVLPAIWVDDDPLGVRSEGVQRNAQAADSWGPLNSTLNPAVDADEVSAIKRLLPSGDRPDTALSSYADDRTWPPRRIWWTFATSVDAGEARSSMPGEHIGYTTAACTNFGWPDAILQRVAIVHNRRCLVDEQGRPSATASEVRWRLRWGSYFSAMPWLSPVAVLVAYLLLLAASSISAAWWFMRAGRRAQRWTCTECGCVGRVRGED